MTDRPTLEIAPTAACLVLLCKRPALGHSKQRLAAQLGLEQTFKIAQHLLDCALEDLQHWPGPKALAPDHPQHVAWGKSLCPLALCLAQHQGNLGQRLNDLDRRLRAPGQQRLLFIGSDCPVLQPSDYRTVCELLDAHDTVLLKARDGGVVLMASNRPWPDLRDLPWSTEHLAQALADKCQAAGHSLVQTGDYFDIDHQEDLQLLARALEPDTRPARLRLRDALHDLGIPAHA